MLKVRAKGKGDQAEASLPLPHLMETNMEKDDFCKEFSTNTEKLIVFWFVVA